MNNGILTVSAASLIVTAESATRTYGAANPTFTGTLSGVQNGDPITASYTTGATASSPVGSYAIVPSFNDLGSELNNYIVIMNNGSLTVSPTVLIVTTDNASRNYGVPNPDFTGSLSGLQNDDLITVAYSTGATASSPVGNYAIVPTLNDPGDRLNNYSVTTNAGSLTITIPSFSASNVSRTTSSFTCTVVTADGPTYVLEYKSSFEDSDWSVSQSMSGNGGIVSFSDDSGTNHSRFYRIRAQ
jgi:hypothetical protein